MRRAPAGPHALKLETERGGMYAWGLDADHTASDTTSPT